MSSCSCFLKLYTEWYPVLKRSRSLMSGSEKFRLQINGSILLHSFFEFLWRVRFQELTLFWDRASLLNGLLYNKELSNTQFGIRRLTWSYSIHHYIIEKHGFCLKLYGLHQNNVLSLHLFRNKRHVRYEVELYFSSVFFRCWFFVWTLWCWADGS